MKNKNIGKIRRCPFCEVENNATLGAPYQTCFNNKNYYYIKTNNVDIIIDEAG